MNKRSTRTDVAKLAGVSVATVSYVVNKGPRPVSEATRRRVLEAIETLRYRPHAIARSLRTGNTRTIGVLVPSLLPSYVGYLVNAVEDHLVQRDYGLILASSHEDCEREHRMLDILAMQQIDGLLFIPASCRNRGPVIRFIEEGIPVVFMDRTIPGVQADTVMSDNVQVARDATSYMFQQGCRRVVCISFSDEASSALDRVEGYRLAHQDNGLEVDEANILVVKYAEGATGEPRLEAYIRKFGLPGGVLCTTDGFVVDAMKSLQKLGVRVPEQVMVAGGFFDSPWNALLNPPLPIIRQDFRRVAQRAVELLMDRLNGNDSPPQVELVPAEFIVQP